MSTTISGASLLLDGTAGYVDLYPPAGYLNKLRLGKFAIVMVLQPGTNVEGDRFWSAEGNSASELLTDGNFETGTMENWDLLAIDDDDPSTADASQTSITHIARTSRHALHLIGPDTGHGVVTSAGANTFAGHKYRLRAAFERRAKAGTAGGVSNGLTYSVQRGDDNSANVVGTQALSVLNRFDVVNTSYTEAGTGSSAKVTVKIHTGHANDEYYIDNVSLRRTSESPRLSKGSVDGLLQLYWETSSGNATMYYDEVTDNVMSVVTATFDPDSTQSYGSVNGVAEINADETWTGSLVPCDVMKIRLGAEADTATNYSACNWIFFALLDLTTSNPTISSAWDAALGTAVLDGARSDNWSRSTMRAAIRAYDANAVGYYWDFAGPGTSGAFDLEQLSVYKISDGTEYSVTAPVS